MLLLERLFFLIGSIDLFVTAVRLKSRDALIVEASLSKHTGGVIDGCNIFSLSKARAVLLMTLSLYPPLSLSPLTPFLSPPIPTATGKMWPHLCTDSISKSSTTHYLGTVIELPL